MPNIKCVNSKFHMREICKSAEVPNSDDIVIKCEPNGSNCDHLLIDRTLGFTENEIEAIRNQTGRHDTKTAPLFGWME